MLTMQCIVVTPEATVRDEAADFVALPLFDGEIGIAPGHTPVDRPAGLRRDADSPTASRPRVITSKAASCEVLDNVVSVLTRRQVLPSRSTWSRPKSGSWRRGTALARSSDEMALRDQAVARPAPVGIARRAAASRTEFIPFRA